MSLITKYRPKTFDEVMGNEVMIKTLRSQLERDFSAIPHAFLFTGPAGCGKTSLAYIVSEVLGCKGRDLDYTELNAADYKGIDTIRTIIQRTHQRPMNGKSRVWILDETGQLTRDAQAALLKALEKPPAHAFFIFCTTDPGNLSTAFKQRCSTYEVSQLKNRQLMTILHDVCKNEGKKVSVDHLKIIAGRSTGSPREALKILDQVIDLDPTEREEALKETEEPKKFILSRLGNVERFVHEHGKDICYSHEKKGTWLTWEGTRWAKESEGSISRKAKQTIRNIRIEAQLTHDEALEEWWKKCDTPSEVRSIINAAPNEPQISINKENLDADIWLLNCKNGTINLKTGVLQPHNRDDKITRLIEYEYDSEAECPTWDSFVDFVADGNDHIKNFLQRIVGYTLTGDVSGKCLFFLYGPTNTGKSTFLETIRKLMSEYTKQADFKTFIYSKVRSSIRNDIARLEKARFVSAVESGQGESLDLPVLKLASGGDTITARYLYNENFEFMPEFKIWLASNHFPKIVGADAATWDRIYPIPFNKQVTNEDRDGNLRKKFELEMSGILNWAVDGCLMCYDEDHNLNLRIPVEILEAKKNLRGEVDLFPAFISECCDVNPSFHELVGVLYEAWVAWCKKKDIDPGSEASFTKAMIARGFETKQMTIHSINGKYKLGIKIKG